MVMRKLTEGNHASSFLCSIKCYKEKYIIERPKFLPFCRAFSPIWQHLLNSSQSKVYRKIMISEEKTIHLPISGDPLLPLVEILSPFIVNHPFRSTLFLFG